MPKILNDLNIPLLKIPWNHEFGISKNSIIDAHMWRLVLSVDTSYYLSSGVVSTYYRHTRVSFGKIANHKERFDRVIGSQRKSP